MQREQDFYIPPDVEVNSDGSIAQDDWPKVYNFDNTTNRYLLSFTGWGMPPIIYIEQRGPLQSGKTILKFRLDERIVQYNFRHSGCTRQDYWDNRGTIMNALRPNRQTSDDIDLGRLRKILPNGEIRDLDALIQQGPIFASRNPSQWDEAAFTETLRFKCPDPTVYDPERVDIVWDVDVYQGLIFYASPDYEAHLTLPDNMVFGSDVVSGITNITYTGTWLAYPIIYVTGPISSPLIQNTTLGVKIELQYDVSAGETLIIDTTYGRKRIYSNFDSNLIGTLTDDSDLNSFYIVPDPYAVGGVNTLTAQGSGAIQDVTEIRLTYFTRYIGI